MNIELENRIAQWLSKRDFDAALTAIEEGYGPELFGFIRMRTATLSDAEDAYGDFRLAMVRGIRTFQQRSAVRTWAYVVARNELLASNRRRIGRAQVMSEVPPGSQPEPTDTRPTWQRTTGFARLGQLRALLDDEEQELFVLRVDREMPFSEIALVLSSGSPNSLISAEACKQRFHRLKDKLVQLHREHELP